MWKYTVQPYVEFITQRSLVAPEKLLKEPFEHLKKTLFEGTKLCLGIILIL